MHLLQLEKEETHAYFRMEDTGQYLAPLVPLLHPGAFLPEEKVFCSWEKGTLLLII